jgi:hypothetical protein
MHAPDYWSTWSGCMRTWRLSSWLREEHLQQPWARRLSLTDYFYHHPGMSQ